VATARDKVELVPEESVVRLAEKVQHKGDGRNRPRDIKSVRLVLSSQYAMQPLGQSKGGEPTM
jgi:hypothetical protein